MVLPALPWATAPGLAQGIAQVLPPVKVPAPVSTPKQSLTSAAPAAQTIAPGAPLAPALAPVPASGPGPKAVAPGTTPTAAALPLATQLKGNRPKSNPNVLAPAATTLPPGLGDLLAPNPLALPNKPSQVRIQQLSPLGLADVETLTEVNNPSLKTAALEVDQAQSELRAQIALWYPTLQLSANAFPTYTFGQGFNSANPLNPLTGSSPYLSTNIWQMDSALQLVWPMINPSRNPKIAAARDRYEQAKNRYLILLRDKRTEAAEIYFDLQAADEQVRIGQESVRASLVSLRDARARFQAGVATKLEVLEADTQLARDQQVLTNALADQAIARRNLASLLSLPQFITPTAKDPARVVGTWLPSLQESIVAGYAFREELDNIILDISIANSDANAQLADVQPFINIVNNLGMGRSRGFQSAINGRGDVSNYGWSIDNALGMNVSWRLYDGGQSQAQYRRQKQAAEASTYRFAAQRDSIRQQVEESFYELERNNRNITTTSREVITSRESLRLARLRFQAGVSTQREVVDTQRDVTQAEVRWSLAISNYNKSLARLRRRTGLDQIALCKHPQLPAIKPFIKGVSDVPVEPQPLIPACRAELSLGIPPVPASAQ